MDGQFIIDLIFYFDKELCYRKDNITVLGDCVFSALSVSKNYFKNALLPHNSKIQQLLKSNYGRSSDRYGDS